MKNYIMIIVSLSPGVGNIFVGRAVFLRSYETEVN